MPLPSFPSKPVVIGSIATGLLLVTLVGLKLLPAGTDNSETGNSSTIEIPPQSRTSPDNGSSGNTSRKSSVQRPATGKIESDQEQTTPSRKEAMVAVSVQARRDLKLLRESSRDEFETPEAREAFAETISNISDPGERKRLLEERAESMRIARDRADAEKGFPGRAREKRLIALMQVQNLWRMNTHLSKNRSLKTEAAKFDGELMEWVENYEGMSDQDFHQSFNNLRRTLNELRIRDQAASTSQP